MLCFLGYYATVYVYVVLFVTYHQTTFGCVHVSYIQKNFMFTFLHTCTKMLHCANKFSYVHNSLEERATLYRATFQCNELTQ